MEEFIEYKLSGTSDKEFYDYLETIANKYCRDFLPCQGPQIIQRIIELNNGKLPLNYDSTGCDTTSVYCVHCNNCRSCSNCYNCNNCTFSEYLTNSNSCSSCNHMSMCNFCYNCDHCVFCDNIMYKCNCINNEKHTY